MHRSMQISFELWAGLRTGTFFCVTHTTESLPLQAMLVMPAAFTALKAYSAVTKHSSRLGMRVLLRGAFSKFD